MLSFTKDQVLLDSIPENLIGVYYFLDNSDKILYIGKSIDIKSRIKQHLLKGRKRLISLFVKVKIKVLKSELEALLFESQEIKINKPVFNRRLRKTKNHFFLHVSKNSNGYLFFDLKNTKKGSKFHFNSLKSLKNFILNNTEKFNLCEKINLIDKSNNCCFKYQLNKCFGACIKKENTENYNKRFLNSLESSLEIPKNCQINFKINNIVTFINIEKSLIKSYGVKNFTKHKIVFNSNDELKILTQFARKNKYSIIEYK